MIRINPARPFSIILLCAVLLCHAQAEVLLNPKERDKQIDDLRNDPVVIRLKRTLLLTDLDYIRLNDKEILAQMEKSREIIGQLSAKQTKEYEELEKNSRKLYGDIPEPQQEMCASLYGVARETWIKKVKSIREPGPTTKRSALQADNVYMQQRGKCLRHLKAESTKATR
ncbi:MAG: hypothetical protein H6R18_1802 [Proteobacteria bacterium]|nr:hypothetical protein [Pseudomonadota bacterium]